MEKELIILKAQVNAYGTVFVWASVVLLIGSALSLLINVSKERMQAGHGEEIIIEA